MFAMGICALGFLATVSMLTYTRLHNDLEQERARAHQLVSQKLEECKFSLYTQLVTGSAVTVWDNGTPTLASDDTTGQMSVIVKNAFTGATISAAPNPAVLVQVEVTLTWHPRGSLNNKTFRETEMTYIAPT